MSDIKSPAISYLEFGSYEPDTGNRYVYDFRKDSQAYDWFMHARYANDIVTYHDLLSLFEQNRLDELHALYVKHMHHPNDFLFTVNKALALTLTRPRFAELGQTLFGCIDALIFVRALLSRVMSDLIVPAPESIHWVGVDISHYFNRLAKLMHCSCHVSTSSETQDLQSVEGVFFAKGITLLYAVADADSLANMLSQGEIALFDYSFRLQTADKTQIGTGLDVHYLDRATFLDSYKRIRMSGRNIWVRGNAHINEAQGTLYIEGFCASENMAMAYLELQRQWHDAWIQAGTWLAPLLHEQGPEYFSWQPLSSALSQLLPNDQLVC